MSIKIYTGTEDIDDLIGWLVRDPAYKELYYQYNTRNTSFITTAKQLKEKRVVNHNFMLSLYDKTLNDINPFDKDLSYDIKARVILECKKNIWYFLREIALYDNGADKPRKFTGNIGNITQTWCFVNGIDSCLTIPLESFFDTFQTHILGWLLICGTTRTSMQVIDTSASNACLILDRIKYNLKHLPQYMNLGYPSIENHMRLKSNISQNDIKAVCKARSEELATNIARSLTSPVLFFNLLDRIPFIKKILDSSEAAYTVCKLRAIQSNTAYGKMMSSIPGDLSDPNCVDVKTILDSFRRWDENIFDSNIKELLLRDDSPFYIEYNYKETGLTEDYYNRMKRKFKNDNTRFKREILLERV